MINVILLGLMGTLEFAVLTWLVARFAEGMFQLEFDGWHHPSRGTICSFGGVFAAVSYVILGVASHCSWTVPTSDFYTYGLFGPVLGMLGCIAAGTAFFGGVRLLGTLGKIMHGCGSVVSSLRERWSKRGKSPGNAVKTTASQWAAARRKFENVRDLCKTLRLQFKNNASAKQVVEISSALQRVRKAIEEDSSKKSVVPRLLSDYLMPTEQALELYERLLTSRVKSARPALKEMEQKTLPLMHARIVALYDQIHVVDIAKLSTTASVFEVARKLEVKVEAVAEAEALAY